MKITGIIPARYASTRFPGKPLADIGGKSMIRRVYEQAGKAKALRSVVVATDDERIAAHVRDFGGNVVMTGTGSRKHLEDNIRAIAMPPLPAPVVDKLRKAFGKVTSVTGDVAARLA